MMLVEKGWSGRGMGEAVAQRDWIAGGFWVDRGMSPGPSFTTVSLLILEWQFGCIPHPLCVAFAFKRTPSDVPRANIALTLSLLLSHTCYVLDRDDRNIPDTPLNVVASLPPSLPLSHSSTWILCVD